MFEAHALHLLRKYLGEYVEGLSTEALRISVWKGDVTLKDLKLKAEALNSLNLPVTVKAGFVGTITLKVPWKSLGKEPVVVLIDRVFVLAHPAPNGETLKEKDREKIFEAKLQQIEETESATLEAATRTLKGGTAPDGNSWLGSLIATIIGNLKVTISNVHIRYEDSVSNQGHPFCSGVTLSRLAAVTTDEQGSETFDTSGALDKLRKSLQLQRLAVYHDSDSPPWKPDKKWENLHPSEWTEIFQDGVDELASNGAMSVWAKNRTFLLSPINGVLKYHRLGKLERHDPMVPFEKASLVLSDVSLTISEAQYYDGIKLLETFSRYKTRVEVSHLRPIVPVSKDPHAWWHYAALAGLQQKKLCYWFSWERIRHLCQLRRRYVQLYAASLQKLSNDLSEIRQIERVLDSKVIILWRLLAHAKVESVKSKEASSNVKSWWSFGWRTSPDDASAASSSANLPMVKEERLTKEEWQAINKMLSYQADEDTNYLSGRDLQTMIQLLVDVSIGQAAARIVSINQTEVVCGRFEQLHVTTKLYHKSVHCDVSLRLYGLSSPEGSLVQSVISERKINALDASFVHSPIGEDIDWRLSATIAPCHVTILMESYDRFVEFVKRSNAISPTVAMETASALQMKIEQVTRRAQEQLQIVMEEHSRFALDIDFDAPKIKVPMKGTDSSSNNCQFLLDFGNFTLDTREGQQNELRQSLYSQFYISGRDMAAFFIDSISNVNSQMSLSPTSENVDHFYSILDRCGMSVIVDQIKVPHPSYPSTRVSVQVPNLGIHLSPERYCRIMELLNIFYGVEESSDQDTGGCLQTSHVPWHPADLATVSRILVWKGFSHSLAEWQPCFLVLSGLYLYVLESEVSQNYQRSCSMSGRQVFEVSPTSVGGSLYAIAVSSRGVDVQKALESTSTMIIEFRDEEEKVVWLKALVQATYRASAHPTLDILGESFNSLSEPGGSRLGNMGTPELIVNGALIETKLSIYGKLDRSPESAEALIIELLGTGGKVNMARSGGGLTVKTKLHSLKIKDELQGRVSHSPQYLVRSVLNDNSKDGGSCTSNINEEMHSLLLEEDDCFKDAMPDFVSTPDHNSTYNPSLSDPFEQYSSTSDAFNHDKDQIKGKPGEIFYEAHDNNISDFVVVTFLTRNPDSPLYDGIDTQLSIRMSALEFFCNRPTLVALIEFGFALSVASSRASSTSDMDVPVANYSSTVKKEDNGRALIKGLLGYGKGRVIFNLSMDADSVCVFLNKEDGSQLAMFVQEGFLLDLKVHPGSISIESTLGNMRLCDMSLGRDHRWGWLCDIRNQEVESLIKFTFQSYSAEDDDYQGYDYSLCGRLSAVRIVFLYRFIQEVTSYFMELASPHTQEVIKLVDKVGGIEWLIQKYEIQGAAAIKLDLSLDTPIIIVPKNSMSEDYMQLDLGQLKVKNDFSWHGCKESDPSAVHLDILYAELHGVNMAIGINGLLGKPMVQDCEGFHIQVRRSLRDVFHKIPTLALHIQVGLLHGVMSDKEYNVIINCLYMNLFEPPNLPPSFRGNTAGTKESIRMLADKVNLSGQVLMARSVLVVAVEIHYAFLELCSGLTEGSPLAKIALEGLWVYYRSSSLSEMDVYVTIPKFSILDIRPDSVPEMCLMLGSYTDVSKLGLSNISNSISSLVPDVSKNNLENASDMEVSNLTMLVMDYRWRPSLQSFVIRVQQPRILVVLDFLLAVVEFFIPALGTITGRVDTMHPKNDPLNNSDNIILSEHIYMQTDDLVQLSPGRLLIVDGCGIDEFIYDGCGHTLSFSEEFDLKGESCSGTIVIIGRGKKLRFKNVKIENGLLLRKCTYLSNGSSYSVSVDDGVEISLFDNFTSDLLEEGLVQGLGSESETRSPNTVSDVASSQLGSFTFEAQIVSPEFTFFDCSKLSVDDSLHIEKLIRAKMDLSFMYAWKENDTWARFLVKDLSVEAGSGLVILKPVDISGGYTSVKEKTNISVISTDICVHLSLGVASLLLQLQIQSAAALQFGNANPVTLCTNFNRVWVSRKGNIPGYNLTFWRPQAPANYVILGDCVTSRPIPPSLAVLAVSNIYGRVRKPVGFKRIVSFSDFQELEDKGRLNTDNDCSIWMPIPPPGYTAVGCVVHLGNQPPPNHFVYCLRSDLVTSSCFSDCVFYVAPNPRILTGFSVWRVDNGVGSFFAYKSVDCPPMSSSLDLHQILVRDMYSHQSFPDKPSSNDSVGQYQQEGNSFTTSSGWDIVRSLSKVSYYMSTPHFERIWWDKGCDLRRAISVWRPVPRPGFSVLGDCITEGLEPPALGLVFKCDNSVISAKPVQFTKVAHIIRKGMDDVYFWYPIPPPGYASLGCVATRTDDPPKKDVFCCPRIDLVNQANISEEPISRSSNSKGTNNWSIWKVENQAYTFLARSDLRKPSNRLAYSISDYVKPKTRENISAEIKLGCLSITVLDSLGGMIAPLLDTTVTNLNLATHGRLDSMNAVLVCSIAASTFNRQLESWEPFVEPFDGIFKVETYDTGEHPSSKLGKRVRVAATSTVNLNVSAANLETLTEALVSWDRQLDLEKKSSRKNEGTEFSRHIDDLTVSALDEDDFRKVIIENRLGCDIYLRNVEQATEKIELLRNDDQTSLLMPPPRFSDRLSVVSKSRETRYYVAVQIIESKGLPIVDDGSSHDYFCALRLLFNNKVPDVRKLFPQSARTRCVKPMITSINGLVEGYAKWNELFIFEVPEKGLSNLEIEITNLASKAGKGDVIGALSIPVGNSATTLKRAASIRILQQAADVRHFSSYPLKKKGQIDTNGGRDHCGSLVICTSYFERETDMNFKKGIDSTAISDRDIGFRIGFGPDGAWESFSSVLPLAVVPKLLDRKPFAFEVVMKNGRKHAILRALAVVVNDADIKLEVAICSESMLSSPLLNLEPGSSVVMTEEIFENQRYEPMSGWESNWPASDGNDPKQWSTRDYSYSSKEFFEPPLPCGWRWTSAWKIERTQFVDNDGWLYGTDFQSLKNPISKSSFKSALDVVRRRRWIRTRQQLSEENIDSKRNVIGVIDPGSSVVLPWASMFRDSDLCLQVRPYGEKSQEAYSWGQMVTLSSGKDQSISQQASLSRQNTLRHPNNISLLSSVLKLSQLEKKDLLSYCNPSSNAKQYFWLSVGADASVLHTELNDPVYDWRISINSALRLENKLPFQAEFAIWEKTTDGSMAERQHGVISPGGCAFIYSADLRKPIYLTLFVQGGWTLEKDAVLIMDLLSLHHASSFWMVQQKRNRRLRVSVEHEMGGTDLAPKTVRLFVPYWISNDLSIPLSYHIIDVDSFDNLEIESPSISRLKSAKHVLRQTSRSFERRSSSKRNTQIFEVIDDFNPRVMLSPQEYIHRSGIMSLQSRNDVYSSSRVGISIAVRHSEHFSPGISLVELERKERIDVRACASDGSYYKLSAQLKMASNRTKVIHFLPQTLLINRLGRDLCICQSNTELAEWLHPNDPPKLLKWYSGSRNELLRVRMDGYRWSMPFSIEKDGIMCVCMNTDEASCQMYIIVEVRVGNKCSRYEVVFRLASLSSPYRIENRSMFLSIRFRQIDSADDSWRILPPNAAASFFWEDLGRQRLLEVLVDGTDPLRCQKYNIDEVMDHQPMQSSTEPIKALRMTVMKEGKIFVSRISDWMPDNEAPATMQGKSQSLVSQPSETNYEQSSSALNSELHITFELTELGISVIDHMPEEILYLSVQTVLLSYSSGLDSGISRFKLRMHWAQVDNQLPFSPMPVLFRPQRVDDDLEYILKFSMTMQTNDSLDFCVYPYIGLQGPDSSAFLINIHEPIIWRLHEMFQQVKLNRTFTSPTTAVSVDPMIKIGLLNISEIRIKVSMTMSPAQRPRGVLGFWSSLMTALGNTEHMPVRVTQRFHEGLSMRQSALISTAISNIQKDILSQPLQLLSGVDILGNASSALSNMSKGVAALSMDKKFIQGRQKQDSKGVEDFGDVIREGGGALAKGFFRGVTGILTKPLEGAKSSGVEGFVHGVGKGLIGVAAQPMSGVLDLLSKTTEGANAVRMKIASTIASEEQLLRRRLPRVISGDNLLRPYDEYKATGQAILQLAESGAFFVQVDLFKVRGKFALSDAYEDHFVLPKGKILLVTHRRILMLQQPSNIMTQRKFNPARDSCSVLWDVSWDGLVTMELVHGKKDHPGSLPSRLILYLRTKLTESKENSRVIKCSRESHQASDIYLSIDQAMRTYGPNASKDLNKRKVPRPYTPSTSVSSPEVFGIWGFQEDQETLPMNSAFGTVIAQGQPEQSTFNEIPLNMLVGKERWL